MYGPLAMSGLTLKSLVMMSLKSAAYLCEGSGLFSELARLFQIVQLTALSTISNVLSSMILTAAMDSMSDLRGDWTVSLAIAS